MAGSKEDVETVRGFFQDLRAREPGDPLLGVCDGAPGSIRPIEECRPRGHTAHDLRSSPSATWRRIWRLRMNHKPFK